jgi:branched-chain amino acid transport system ATP-binding protein
LIAVNDISFSVREGDVYGIAGPNGAGKTTLFNLISRIPFRADSGQILFDGRDLRSMSADGICHLGITRTFQTEVAFDALTVEENVRIGAVFGRRSEDIDAAVRHALDFVGLSAQLRSLAGTLPLYAKKRLMLASAVACHPRLLLLDEPAAGLSRNEYEELAGLIRTLHGEGVTIVLIEHVLPLLLSVSSRVMIMNQGALLIEAAPDEVVHHPEVIEAYLGERGTKVLDARR